MAAVVGWRVRAAVAVGGMMCMVVCVGEREVQACVVRRRPARRRVQAVRVRVRRCLVRRTTREQPARLNVWGRVGDQGQGQVSCSSQPSLIHGSRAQLKSQGMTEV